MYTYDRTATGYMHPMVLLDFPDARQATNFTCGAASVQAVLYYYGMEWREDNLVRALDVLPTSIENSGVRPEVLVGFLQKQGLEVDAGTKTIAQVKAALHHGFPTILAIQAWNEAYAQTKVNYSKTYDDGHYVVAIGYTKDGVLFDDPSIISNRGFLSFEELESRWHDQDSANHRYEHYGITVKGTPKFRSKQVFRIR